MRVASIHSIPINPPQMSTQSIIGSGTAVLGVLVYSLAKHYCK